MDPQLALHIRQRPSNRQHNRKYQLCQNKAPCEYGSKCIFAHSEEELHHWLKSRAKDEPRQRPPIGTRPPYRMCENVQVNGYCLDDVQCIFPHSEEELHAWTRYSLRRNFAVLYLAGLSRLIFPQPLSVLEYFLKGSLLAQVTYTRSTVTERFSSLLRFRVPLLKVSSHY